MTKLDFFVVYFNLQHNQDKIIADSSYEHDMSRWLVRIDNNLNELHNTKGYVPSIKTRVIIFNKYSNKVIIYAVMLCPRCHVGLCHTGMVMWSSTRFAVR